MKKIILVLIILVVSLSNIVSGESGSILISDDNVTDYSRAYPGAGGSNSDIDLQSIKFDTANFNYLSSFHFHPLTNAPLSGCGFTASRDYESSDFTIIANGTTSGTGFVYYSKNFNGIYYVFPSDLVVTGSPLRLNFTHNFTNNFTWGEPAGGCRAVNTINSGMPVGLSSGAFTVAGSYHSVSTSSRATDYYDVTYPYSNYFRVNITKNSYLNTNYSFYGHTTNYFNETSFNKVNIVNLVLPYVDGLYINASLQSGYKTIVLVNSTNISTAESYNILFNKTSYNLNDDISFVVNISNFVLNSSYVLNFYQEKIDETVDSTTFTLSTNNMYFTPSISKNSISFLYAQIYKDGSSVYVSDAIPYGMNQNISSITGNITIDKSQYSLNENINIKYNTSTSGRIIVQCDDILYSESVYSGNNLQTNYTLSELQVFPCQVKLQYYYTVMNQWVTIDYETFESISGIDNVFFSKDYISLGETIDVYYNSMGVRILTLKDSSGNIKFNYTIPLSQYGLYKSYILKSTDLTGNYTAYLNYTNDTIIDSVIIKVMDAIVIIPTSTTNETYRLLDLFSDGAIAVIGDFDRDDSGSITDNGIKKKGDRFLPIIIFLCVVILVSGTWNKIKGK